MKIVAINTYLIMRAPTATSRDGPDAPGMTIRLAVPDDAAVYRDLYHAVGGNHAWFARCQWSVSDFSERISDHNVHVWLAFADGQPAGFAELERHEDGTIQLKFLGVSPAVQRRGLGKRVLACAVGDAWRMRPRFLWLLTRNYDGPYALANYLKRGFTVWKRRPALVGVPPGCEEAAREAVRRSRRDGTYPNWTLRALAGIRESAPGDAVRARVYRLRQAFGPHASGSGRTWTG